MKLIEAREGGIASFVQDPFAEGLFNCGDLRNLEVRKVDNEDSDDSDEVLDITPPKRHRTVSWPTFRCSRFAARTINPIRKIVDVMSVEPNPSKALIKLHIGDPTITGVLPIHIVAQDGIIQSLSSGKYNGYGPSVGLQETRQAIAESATMPGREVTANDVIVTSGCSHAIQMAIEVLAHPGYNILIPSPGFPIYTTLITPLGVEPREYNLLMEKGWEIDLAHLKSLIDEKTAGIILNNPSNPCGAVYSKEHLMDLLRLAEEYQLPIIADEIYGDMVYDGAKFHPLASLAPNVPVLTCDGLSKRYLVPGWRLGWLIMDDHEDALTDVRQGLQQLSQKIVGPSSLIQGAVPYMLKNTPAKFFDNTREVLSKNAGIVMSTLHGVPGINPVKSYGAMYIMVVLDMKQFPGFKNELDMVRLLISEESIYCLPGGIFGFPGALRLVITHKEEAMKDACERIKEFCLRHRSDPDIDMWKSGPSSSTDDSSEENDV